MHWRILWKTPDPDSFLLAPSHLKLIGRVPKLIPGASLGTTLSTTLQRWYHRKASLHWQGSWHPFCLHLHCWEALCEAFSFPAPSLSILLYQTKWNSILHLSLRGKGPNDHARNWKMSCSQHYCITHSTTIESSSSLLKMHCRELQSPTTLQKGNKQNPLTNKEKRKHAVVIISPAVDMLSGIFPTHTFKVWGTPQKM